MFATKATTEEEVHQDSGIKEVAEPHTGEIFAVLRKAKNGVIRTTEDIPTEDHTMKTEMINLIVGPTVVITNVSKLLIM